MDMLYQLIKPLLFQLDAERAHELTMRLGRWLNDRPSFLSLLHKIYGLNHPSLERRWRNLFFPNPVGIAAGFDKNGQILQLLQALGFGFLELGSITAKPSQGNPTPRLFRLPIDRALINRMGLNNKGAELIVSGLRRESLHVPLGINIAKTHDPAIMGDQAIDDYATSMGIALKGFDSEGFILKKADYITLNISCPNTAEGITFEDPIALQELLATLMSLPNLNQCPVFLKFSPDLPMVSLDQLLQIGHEYGIAGYCVTNTSVGRSGLKTDPNILAQYGRGGLSGSPLRNKATAMVRHIRMHSAQDTFIIGLGGIDSVETARERLDAGADVIQLYTGLVYEGPGLPRRILKGLVASAG